jgi:hypothetical protein
MLCLHWWPEERRVLPASPVTSSNLTSVAAARKHLSEAEQIGAGLTASEIQAPRRDFDLAHSFVCDDGSDKAAVSGVGPGRMSRTWEAPI